MTKEQETAMYDQPEPIPMHDMESFAALRAELERVADAEPDATPPMTIDEKLDAILARMDAVEKIAQQVQEAAEPLIEKFSNNPMFKMLGGF